MLYRARFDETINHYCFLHSFNDSEKGITTWSLGFVMPLLFFMRDAVMRSPSPFRGAAWLIGGYLLSIYLAGYQK
tara:strand:- start:86 stop:310 length:225 start_codon:yes stop_codon:yes gene_type:complete